MAKYIDLSYTIEDGLMAYPDDDKLKLYQNRFLDKDKYNDTKLETGMHVGTHIDVASHMMDSNVLISDYLPEKFIGKGCLIDVRGQKHIKMKTEYLSTIEEDSIVLIYTGFEERFGLDEYFNNHPIVESDFAEFLVKKKIKMIGMDLPSPDKYPFDVHKILLENNVLIIENLKNLGSLLEINEFEVLALPLKVKAQGALARVVARFSQN